MFQNIELNWKGQHYTIEGTRLLPLIAQIEEEVATVFEICAMYSKGKPKGSVIAKALAITLRYVGVKGVTEDDVYYNVVRGRAMDCLIALVNIMSPQMKEVETGAATDEKKPQLTDSSKPAT